MLLDDASGLVAMAICHLGAGTEAGSRGCYVKFGLARPGPGADARFGALLDACEALAVEHGADHTPPGFLFVESVYARKEYVPALAGNC